MSGVVLKARGGRSVTARNVPMVGWFEQKRHSPDGPPIRPFAS